MKNTPMDNNEEIEAGLTRSREAREDEEAVIKPNVEELSTVVVDAAFHLHRDLEPGLLESVYEGYQAHREPPSGLRVFAASREPGSP